MSVIQATVQLRRDTAANWTANNPTLLAGEVGIETDTRRMKFGNGTQAWTALAYAQGTAAQVNTGTGASDVPTITQADARYRLKSEAWNIIKKATSTSRVNNTLLADPDLVLPMSANTNYTGTITVYATSSAAADFKSRVTGPASPTRVLLSQAVFGPLTPGNRIAAAYDTTDLVQLNATDFFVRMLINFSIENGPNAGNLAFEWAQNTTTGGSPTIVLSGSTLEWTTF